MVDTSCVVFFSHSSADRDWVHRLARQARTSGVEVYLAEHDVKPGQPLSEKVTKVIEASNAVIVPVQEQPAVGLCSTGDWGRHHAGKIVIPILMDEVVGSDLGILNDREYIRLDPWGPGDALARLSIALGNVLEAQRKQLALKQAAKQSQDEALVVAGAVLLVIGLIVISQGTA